MYDLRQHSIAKDFKDYNYNNGIPTQRVVIAVPICVSQRLQLHVCVNQGRLIATIMT
jgi:hypothetical protein